MLLKFCTLKIDLCSLPMFLKNLQTAADKQGGHLAPAPPNICPTPFIVSHVSQDVEIITQQFHTEQLSVFNWLVVHISVFKCKLAINNISSAVSLAHQLSLQWQLNPPGVEPPLSTAWKWDGKKIFPSVRVFILKHVSSTIERWTALITPRGLKQNPVCLINLNKEFLQICSSLLS